MKVVIELDLSEDSEPDVGATISGASEDAIREAVYCYLEELIADDSLDYTVIR